MKCWTFLVLQVLITAAEDTSVAPQQDYCPEPPHERILYRVHEDAVGDDGALAQGSVLRYRCGAGYASSGPISVWNVTCTRSYDGVLHWVLPDHDCRPISCGHPGDVRHGRLLGAVFSFPNRVTYECDKGYQLVGTADLYCQSDGNWDAQVPGCRIVTCEPLENLANGFVETEGNEYGSTARYQCERGFRLRGEAERKCGPDGLWTGYAPTCQEVTCPAPEPPDGGFSDISKDAGPQRLGTVVHYWCPQLLVLVGSRSSSCLSVGVWSFDPPKCKHCPEPPHERILYRVHEDAVGDDGALAQGSVLRYRCGAGYASSGPISVWSVTCTRSYDGVLHWVLPDHDCRPISCGHPGDVRHGRLLGTVFSFPNRVTYECDTGYQLVGTADLYCQSDGNWDAQVPGCRIVTCEPLENLANGFVETEGNEYGSTARYQCERGFRLQGEAERKCGPDGLWTGYAPTCQEVTCPAPEPPDGGFSDISKDAGPQRLGTVVHYWCPQLLVLVGSRSSTCLSVGVWSFDPPKCKPPCEVPKLGNTLIVEEKTLRWGRRTYTEIPPGTQLLNKDNLFLKCEEGYEYNGRSLTPLSCRDGHWDPPQPWCEEKPCRKLPEVKNARVIGPVPHGQELEYKCNPEYRLLSNGSAAYCWLGQVTGTLPKCHQTFCNETGFPKEAVHLILQKAVFYDGEYLDYECDHSFDSTHSRMKCTDGRWIPEDEQPFCKAKDCRLKDIPKIQNGFLEGTPNISHTSVIRFRCNEGYSSDGQQSMWCSYGKWEGRRPSCLEHKAPPHPDVVVQRGGGHDTNTYGAGEDPYGIGSSAKSPQLRSCKFPERQMRFYAADGNVRVLPNDNVAHGTVLRFHCRPLGEIRLVGNESSQCINGTWSNQVPYCYEREQYDVVIRLKDTAGTAVSPDGYLNIDPRFEVEMECESYYYPPRLEMIEPVSSWKRGGVRSILRKAPWRNHYMSAKFSLPEDYEGIVRCSNDNQYPTQIIKIRGRYLHSCKIPAHSDATVVTWENKEIATVGCRRPYVLRGEARAVCLAHSEWEKPFPECVLPAPSNVFNKPGLRVTTEHRAQIGRIGGRHRGS
ncbi:sushi, von Willebrand factor type A, EGF and pentraxin domain-containing protein 1 [Ixodes scapularis]